MLRVFGDKYSGNCYKVKLLLEQLGLPYEWTHVDILKKESRTPEFLARNPVGQIPVLQIEEGVFLPESNAILNYLAEGTDYLPADRLERAQVLRWMFFEQYKHEPTVATARYIIRYLGRPAEQEQALRKKISDAHAALAVMERHLESRRFFVAERYSIADIALYAYTHVAHEGQVDLSPYPAIRAWLGRVKSEPRHISMDD
ncbi:MAG TPA: glutathione S-transferase family protein [Burkholderiaceae bacterium]|nr:glutathione S-transferase family protein [Burkholderiaceae bacterium]